MFDALLKLLIVKKHTKIISVSTKIWNNSWKFRIFIMMAIMFDCFSIRFDPENYKSEIIFVFFPPKLISIIFIFLEFSFSISSLFIRINSKSLEKPRKKFWKNSKKHHVFFMAHQNIPMIFAITLCCPEFFLWPVASR